MKNFTLAHINPPLKLKSYTAIVKRTKLSRAYHVNGHTTELLGIQLCRIYQISRAEKDKDKKIAFLFYHLFIVLCYVPCTPGIYHSETKWFSRKKPSSWHHRNILVFIATGQVSHTHTWSSLCVVLLCGHVDMSHANHQCFFSTPLGRAITKVTSGNQWQPGTASQGFVLGGGRAIRYMNHRYDSKCA